MSSSLGPIASPSLQFLEVTWTYLIILSIVILSEHQGPLEGPQTVHVQIQIEQDHLPIELVFFSFFRSRDAYGDVLPDYNAAKVHKFGGGFNGL